MSVHFVLPFKLENLANKREHWGARARRAKLQRDGAHILTHEALHHERLAWNKDGRLRIDIVRVGKNMMDTDGLTISAKHIRDGIADELAVDDGDPRLIWTYGQRIGKQYGVEITIGVVRLVADQEGKP